MSKLSLAGAWKLRGEFMDVTAARYNEVLRKMDAAPVRATLPAFLKLEDLSEEEWNAVQKSIEADIANAKVAKDNYNDALAKAEAEAKKYLDSLKGKRKQEQAA